MNIRHRIAKTLRRALDAVEHHGDRSPRWPSWAGTYAPARRQLATRWRDASRPHFLISTSPNATAISDQWCTNLIGDGPAVRSGHPNEAMRESLEAGFGSVVGVG